MMPRLMILAALAGAVVLAGCRGTLSDEPPIHPNLNMDFQEKFTAQEANPFFADGRAMRPPVPGTVARGLLRDDAAFFFGRTEAGAYVQQMPVPTTPELLLRGAERYDIYCAVCHGGDGYGQGIIIAGNYGYTPAPSYHDATVRQRIASDGYVYDVITNGVRNMPGYAQQIPVADRWAIVAHIRALQLNQNAAADDVPDDVEATLQQAAPASN